MRTGGILLPVFSLPSPYGIGTLGKGAYRFVDFLERSGQSSWQVLPIGPTGYGASPYQSFSTFAGNPFFIDPELLMEQGYLSQSELSAACADESSGIDYEQVAVGSEAFLRPAYARFVKSPAPAYAAFLESQAPWLMDYALYLALKAEQGQKPWTQWAQPLRRREAEALEAAMERLSPEIGYHCFVQYVFFSQWRSLKAYANSRGIRLIGDLPIYVAMDSADTWLNPELFMLDEALTPTLVAGCPPDAFSKTGQLWGNPLYAWEAHRHEDYRWWIRRVAAAFECFDTLRIDHFRGFASYYAIPYGDPTAEKGHWETGPGMALFDAIRGRLGKLSIIAEDLGFLTPDVTRLLARSGFPGMKVLQFAFGGDSDNAYLPHAHPKKCVVYTGTHDNTTSAAWYKTAKPKERAFAKRYLALSKAEGIHIGLIRGALMSPAQTAIIPMQDYLGLDASARINTPSTVGGNWAWRLGENQLSEGLSDLIAEMTSRYGRNRT